MGLVFREYYIDEHLSGQVGWEPGDCQCTLEPLGATQGLDIANITAGN